MITCGRHDYTDYTSFVRYHTSIRTFCEIGCLRSVCVIKLEDDSPVPGYGKYASVEFLLLISVKI